jgi:hypothetical protein
MEFQENYQGKINQEFNRIIDGNKNKNDYNFNTQVFFSSYGTINSQFIE